MRFSIIMDTKWTQNSRNLDFKAFIALLERVQVPLPALFSKRIKIKQSLEVTRLQGIFVYPFFKCVLSELRGF